MPVYDTNVFSTGFENPGLGATLIHPDIKYSNSVVHKGGQSMLIDDFQAYAIYPTITFSVGLGSATYTAFAFRYEQEPSTFMGRLTLCKVCNASGIPGNLFLHSRAHCGSSWWVNASGYMGGRATIGQASGRTNGGNGDLAYWEHQTGEYNRSIWTNVPAAPLKWHWISIYTETQMFPYIDRRGDVKFVYTAKTSAKLNGEYLGEATCQYHNPWWSNLALGARIGASPEYINFSNETGFFDTKLWIDNYVSSNVELPEGESLA